MKKLTFIAISLLMIFAAFKNAEAAAEKSQSIELTKEQQEVIIGILNNLCGDVWCEGDYNIDFKKIECPKNEDYCNLSYTKNEHGENDFQNEICSIRGFTSFGQFVELDEEHSEPTGSLNPNFYEYVNNYCEF